jgi:hypothetical protein
VGALYPVHSKKNFKPAVLTAYRDTLPNIGKVKSRQKSRFEVFHLVVAAVSARCYVCHTRSSSQVCLSVFHSSRSHQQVPQCSEQHLGSGGSEDNDWDEDSAVDAGPVGAPTDLTAIVASKWLPIADFEDQVTTRQPTFDIATSSRLRGSVRKTPWGLFLAFNQFKLVDPSFEAWRKHAAEHDHKGLCSLDKSMFMRFVALLLRMGVMRPRRLDHHFTRRSPRQPRLRWCIRACYALSELRASLPVGRGSCS